MIRTTWCPWQEPPLQQPELQQEEFASCALTFFFSMKMRFKKYTNQIIG
jgi:hypothetical protein